MSEYIRTQLDGGKWVVTEAGHDFRHPLKVVTFAFDTETQTYFDGKILSNDKLFKKIKT